MYGGTKAMETPSVKTCKIKDLNIGDLFRYFNTSKEIFVITYCSSDYFLCRNIRYRKRVASRLDVDLLVWVDIDYDFTK